MQSEALFLPQPQLMYLLIPSQLIYFITLSFQVPLMKLISLSPLISSKASTHSVKGTSLVACCINKKKKWHACFPPTHLSFFPFSAFYSLRPAGARAGTDSHALSGPPELRHHGEQPEFSAWRWRSRGEGSGGNFGDWTQGWPRSYLPEPSHGQSCGFPVTNLPIIPSP